MRMTINITATPTQSSPHHSRSESTSNVKAESRLPRLERVKAESRLPQKIHARPYATLSLMRAHARPATPALEAQSTHTHFATPNRLRSRA